MKDQKSAARHRLMTEGKIIPLILRLAAPTTVGMFVTALYSMTDALFVSSLGTEASAAVGVTFAIQALLQAIGYTFGVGAASLISRALGSRRDKEAGTYATLALILGAVTGCAVTLIGIVFGNPVIRFLGATPSIHPYALIYSRYLFLSAPFACCGFVASQLLRAEGKAVYSMVGLTVGSLLNIALDPLLIYTLGLGIEGASLATLISQIAGLAVLLSAYVFGKSQLSLFRHVSRTDLSHCGRIFVAGLPSLFRQGCIALATILINHAAGTWGDAAVAALSVVNRVFQLAFSVCLGVGQGMMPVVGFNYGFDRKERVYRAYRFASLLATSLMLLISIPLLIFTPQIVAAFRDDPDVIAIGTVALRAQSAVLVCHGVVTCANMLLQSIGKPFSATVLACARQGILFLPLLFLLPNRFGIESLIWVQPLADALTLVFSIPFLFYIARHLKEKTASGRRTPSRGKV